MSEEFVGAAQFKEYEKRMEADHKRIDKRITLLEAQSKQITDIAISVRELATSVKSMAEEQRTQRNKLDNLEARDGQMWRNVLGYVITAIIGIVLGFVFNHLGIK